MKKIFITASTIIVIVLSWLFYEKPQPPFGADIVVSQEPTYFAEIDENGTVLRVLVVDQDYINTGKLGDPKNWVETTIDGSKGKNYAGKGYEYDKTKDAFIPPMPADATGFDEVKAKWIVPAFDITKIK